MKLKPYLLFVGLVVILCSCVAHSSKIELTWKEIAIGKEFKRWSNMIITKMPMTDKKTYYTYHYNHNKNQLVSCAASDKYSHCSLMDNNPNTKTPLRQSIEQKNRWKYVGVILPGVSYFLSGDNPFEQWTEISFYLSDDGPQYCRHTETKYNFIYNEDGQYLVFKNNKPNDAELMCEKMDWLL